MKKILLGIFSLMIVVGLQAQTKPTTAGKTATAVKPATAAKPVVLKTAEDSLSYAIGILDGNFY